jgi:nitroreductase
VELTAAVRTRASEKNLIEPAPSVDEFTGLLGLAAKAPDHGLLQPWRFILVRGNARHVLGASFAADSSADDPDRAARLPLRAPLLATVVFTPRPAATVPEWEQLAATSAMVNQLMLLLHDRGYGSIWRTGRYIGSADARVMLDLAPAEALLGWLYIGTPDPERPGRSPKPRPVRDKVSVFEPTRCLHSSRCAEHVDRDAVALQRA